AAAPLREQIRRVIFDSEHFTPFELLAADERVLAFVEPEAQEIRGRDELGLARLLNQSVEVSWGIARVRLRRRIGGPDCRPSVSPLRAFQIISLVLAPIGV